MLFVNKRASFAGIPLMRLRDREDDPIDQAPACPLLVRIMATRKRLGTKRRDSKVRARDYVGVLEMKEH
jgi:hypothetical protein